MKTDREFLLGLQCEIAQNIEKNKEYILKLTNRDTPHIYDSTAILRARGSLEAKEAILEEITLYLAHG